MIKTNNFGYGFKHSMSKLKHKTKHDDWSQWTMYVVNKQHDVLGFTMPKYNNILEIWYLF